MLGDPDGIEWDDVTIPCSTLPVLHLSAPATLEPTTGPKPLTSTVLCPATSPCAPCLQDQGSHIFGHKLHETGGLHCGLPSRAMIPWVEIYDCAVEGSPLATTALATTSTMSTTAAPTTTAPVTTTTQARKALCVSQSKDDSSSLNLIKSTEATILRNMHLITCLLHPLLLRISTVFQAAPSPVWVYTAWLLGIVWRYSCMNMDERSATMYTLDYAWNIEKLFCSVSFSAALAFSRSFADLSCDVLEFQIFLVADPCAEDFESLNHQFTYRIQDFAPGVDCLLVFC